MFQTIIQATENFCTHQIREDFKDIDSFNEDKSLITYIDISTSSETKHRIYIVSDLKFAQKVSKLFLEEDESDEETLIDMGLETTNLIVGSAKVIAAEGNSESYTISTPHFTNIEKFSFDYDEQKVFLVGDDSKILVAIKALNA
jgi:hypothetical protein